MINKKLTILLLVITLIAGVFAFSSKSFSQTSVSPVSYLKGYGWSSNIGWISFSSTNEASATPTYGVNVDSNGNLSGYAWSDNIGWISFNLTSGCPLSDPCQPKFIGTNLTGWAKALSADNNGWDGWISLSTKTDELIAYGPNLSGYTLPGYAWGSDVVGWIDFSQVIKESTATASCGAADDQPYSAPPTNNLCGGAGTNSNVVTGTVAYTWRCSEGTSTIDCSASITLTQPTSCTPVINSTNGKQFVDKPEDKCEVDWTVVNTPSGTGTNTCSEGITCTVDGATTTSPYTNKPIDIGKHTIVCTNDTGVSVTLNPSPQCLLNPSYGDF